MMHQTRIKLVSFKLVIALAVAALCSVIISGSVAYAILTIARTPPPYSWTFDETFSNFDPYCAGGESFGYDHEINVTGEYPSPGHVHIGGNWLEDGYIDPDPGDWYWWVTHIVNYDGFEDRVLHWEWFPQHDLYFYVGDPVPYGANEYVEVYTNVGKYGGGGGCQIGYTGTYLLTEP